MVLGKYDRHLWLCCPTPKTTDTARLLANPGRRNHLPYLRLVLADHAAEQGKGVAAENLADLRVIHPSSRE
jgi:hypothetical protein